MAERTLSEIFPGATQTAESLVIPKSALASLTPLSENRADSLIAAFLIQLKAVLGGDTFGADPDHSIVVSPTIYERIEPDEADRTKNWLNREITITLRKPHTASPFDADDY
jgi:hypothetical protein